MTKRLLFLLLALTLVLAGCGAADTPPATAPGTDAAPSGEPRHGGILTYGLVNDPPNMDPHIQRGAADATVIAMVYDRLVTWDRQMNIVPSLAASWDLVDDVTIDFTLNEGVLFHDGSELTSEDVVFSFERIQNPDSGATGAGPFRGVTFEALDTYTVRMTLPEPNAAIFQNLARGDASIVSKAWIEGGADTALEMMGTGPFMFADREPGVSFDLVRNPNYYRAPLPYLDGIRFIPYTDETAKVTAIRTGEIDFIDYVPWVDMDEIERLANAGELKFGSDSEALFMTLYMNPSEPPFNDRRVRQAVAWGMNREAVGRSIFFGRGQPMTGSFIPATFLGYDPSLDGTYGYDPERAMALLEEAGWRDEDGDGIREAHGVEGVEDGTPLMINFLATNAFAMHFTLAEFAQAMLSEIGIGGTVELVDWPTRTQRRLDVRPWEIQADGLGQSITDPSFMDIYFHSTKGQWPARMKFAVPEVDELLNQALASYDDEERAALYNEVDRIMLEEAFFVNVWRREQGEAMQPYVMNFQHTFGTLSYLTLPEVWLDR